MTFAATVLTLFPDAFPGALGVSLVETARTNGLWSLETVDIRSFSRHKHASVDDTPAGGGPGMVLRPDVAAAAIDSVDLRGRALIHMTPRGRPLTQTRVRELAAGPGVVVFCSRFEGLDQRVVEARGMEEVSVGDAVLAGGEIPAQYLIEACVRLLPGVIGKTESTLEESFEGDLLEYPHYTRPRAWEGREIPEVLLSGDHGRVARWRREQAEDTTRKRRPDLWTRYRRRHGDDR
ncbi:tRNA (guanosine(37)-N1)-methyltransferase TrmD [Marinicauda salina]|uniref:tRNA (guanine-N(1)-)-methyltransferase n=1 Tax=Marinicauda salina TaxID=2135793 RepID=A0A2U2BWV9_9PROT|nr:tRNA (guanosine(37)-N1)-methyltransferase TrmD [Marinicauda salina]PWE18454.1 tRNA (guanosine(37)-N1)-methyltransferase TrmD [Marinicauda salina]